MEEMNWEVGLPTLPPAMLGEMQLEAAAAAHFGPAWQWLTRDGGQQRQVAAQAAQSIANLSQESWMEDAWREDQEWQPAQYEVILEFVGRDLENPVTRVYADAMMEHLGAAAAHSGSDREADQFLGALVPLAAKALPVMGKLAMKAAPHLLRGAKKAVQVLRKSPITRPLIQAMPTIVRRTVADIARDVSRGRPLSGPSALRSFARQTHRVLSRPELRRAALQRSVAANNIHYRAQQAARAAIQGVNPGLPPGAAPPLSPLVPGLVPGGYPAPGFNGAPLGSSPAGAAPFGAGGGFPPNAGASPGLGWPACAPALPGWGTQGG